MDDRNTRSSLLWNVMDPDDPYDIRQSMIARLPQHNKNLMSGNLQLVCLMQAAEIQRISQYLEELRLKYREVERKQLDRHSYEVQIRQLTQKVVSSKTQSQQIDKLRDYIKRLTSQLQESREKVRKYEQEIEVSKHWNQLNEKYQSVLLELQRCRQFQGQYKVSQEEMKSLRMRYDQLERDKIKELALEREKYETRIKERIEVETRELRNSIIIYKSEIKELQSKIILYKEQFDAKNHEISIMQSQIGGWDQQRASLYQKISFYQQKQKQFSSAAEELALINAKLKSKSQEIESMINQNESLQKSMRDIQKYSKQVEADREREISRCKELESILRMRDQEIYELREKLGNKISQKEAELQNKVALLSSQIERLTYLLNQKNSEMNELYNKTSKRQSQLIEKITTIEKQLIFFKQSKTQLERQVTILKTNQSNITTSLNKIKELEEELRRMSTTLKLKDQQIYNLEAKVKAKSNQDIEELNSLHRHIHEKESIINSLRMEKNGLEGRINEMSVSISRVRVEEKERYQMANRELVGKINMLEQALRTQRERVAQFKREIEQLNIQKHKFSEERLEIEIKRKISVFEEREVRYRTDIQNYIHNENILKGRIRELETDVEKIQSNCDWYMRKERESAQVIINLQKKYNLHIQQSNRQIPILRQQNQQLQGQRKKLRKQIQNLQQELSNKQNQYNTILRSRVREFEQKNQQLLKQNQMILSEISTYKLQINNQRDGFEQERKNIEEHYSRIYREELQNKDTIIASLERQLEKIKADYETINREGKGYEETIKNYKERLLTLSNELERLGNILKIKNDEIIGLKQELQRARVSSGEVQRLNNIIKSKNDQIIMLRQELQRARASQSWKQQWEIEKNKLQQYYMKEISGLTAKISGLQRERENLRAEIQEIRNKDRGGNQRIVHLEEQIKRYTINITEYEGKIDGLSKRLSEYATSLQAKDDQINRLKAGNSLTSQQRKKYEIQIINLNKIQQQLEDMNAHVLAERDELFRLSHEYKEQVDGLRAKLEAKSNVNMQNYISLEQHQQEITKITAQITQKFEMQTSGESESYRRKLAQLEQNHRTELAHRLTIIREREEQLRSLKAQFDELYKISHEQQDKIRFLEHQSRQSNNSFQHNLTQLRNTNLQITQKYSLLLNQKREYEEKLVLMSQEVERLTSILSKSKTQNEDNEYLHQKMHEYEEEISSLREDSEIIQQKYEKLYYTYQETVSNHERMHGEFENCKKMLSEYQFKIRNIDKQLAGLEDRVRKQKMEKERIQRELEDLQRDSGLEEKNHFLSAEIDRLNILVQSYKKQISDLRLNLTDRVALEKRLEQYMGLMVVLFAEIQTLRNRVCASEQECQNVRRSSLTPYRIDRGPLDRRDR